jgi:hypothetical protein
VHLVLSTSRQPEGTKYQVPGTMVLVVCHRPYAVSQLQCLNSYFSTTVAVGASTTEYCTLLVPGTGVHSTLRPILLFVSLEKSISIGKQLHDNDSSSQFCKTPQDHENDSAFHVFLVSDQIL